MALSGWGLSLFCNSGSSASSPPVPGGELLPNPSPARAMSSLFFHRSSAAFWRESARGSPDLRPDLSLEPALPPPSSLLSSGMPPELGNPPPSLSEEEPDELSLPESVDGGEGGEGGDGSVDGTEGAGIPGEGIPDGDGMEGEDGPDDGMLGELEGELVGGGGFLFLQPTRPSARLRIMTVMSEFLCMSASFPE